MLRSSVASSDGKSFYNVWLQEVDGLEIDSNYELDSWFGRVDIPSE